MPVSPPTLEEAAELIQTACENVIGHWQSHSHRERTFLDRTTVRRQWPSIGIAAGVDPDWSLTEYLEHLRKLAAALETLNELGYLEARPMAARTRIVWSYAIRLVTGVQPAYLQVHGSPGVTQQLRRIATGYARDIGAYRYEDFSSAYDYIVEGRDTLAARQNLEAALRVEVVNTRRRLDQSDRGRQAQRAHADRFADVHRQLLQAQPLFQRRQEQRQEQRQAQQAHAERMAPVHSLIPGAVMQRQRRVQPMLSDQVAAKEHGEAFQGVHDQLREVQRRWQARRQQVRDNLEDMRQRQQMLARLHDSLGRERDQILREMQVRADKRAAALLAQQRAEQEQLEMQAKLHALRQAILTRAQTLSERRATSAVNELTGKLTECRTLEQYRELIAQYRAIEEDMTDLSKFSESKKDDLEFLTTVLSWIDASVHTNGVSGYQNFVTSSAWAGVPGLALAIYDLYLLKQQWGEMSEIERALKSTSVLSTLTAQGAAALAAMDKLGRATGIWQISKAVSKVAGVTAGISGVITGTTQMGLGLVKLSGYAKVGERWQALPTRTRQAILADPELQWFSKKVMTGKLSRKKIRARIDVFGGGVGTTSGTMGILVTLSVGGAAVPIVGWIVTGLAIATVVSVIGYKIGRKQYKKNLLRKKVARGMLHEPPIFVHTTGDYYRFAVANELYKWSLGMYDHIPEKLDSCRSIAHVLLGSDDENTLRETTVQLRVSGLMALLKAE